MLIAVRCGNLTLQYASALSGMATWGPSLRLSMAAGKSSLGKMRPYEYPAKVGEEAVVRERVHLCLVQ
jgi:hypothetical protein